MLSSRLRSTLKRLLLALPWNGFGDARQAILGHPYFIARSGLRIHLSAAVDGAPDGPLLDVGCGTMPYRDLFPRNEPYECLEIDQPRNQDKPHVTHLYAGKSFGLPTASYSAAFSSQTLEHSFAPEEMLSEMYRILRPGGLLILAMPFIWPEHEQPFDSQRFTSFGLQARLEATGFENIRALKTNPGSAALIQLAIEAVERHVRKLLSRVPGQPLRIVTETTIRCLLLAPYTAGNLTAATIRRFTQDLDAVEFYLDLVVSAKKPIMAESAPTA
jgi:SAM-dependent methyltransferase